MNANNSLPLKIAVVGATGLVGETILEILAERQFFTSEIVALASARSLGSTVHFGQQSLAVDDLATFDFSGVDIALFSAGGSVSAEYAPKAAEVGCMVIDNSSHFRYDDDKPLVVPEINGSLLTNHEKGSGGIIANPNCSTIQMVMALAPLHREIGIERINVATYQSVSGAGRKAVQELAEQTRAKLTFETPPHDVFPQDIAFNVLPQIDTVQDNGYSREEMKMVWETRKILDDQNILVNPTAVRVPVFFGHAMAVHLEMQNAFDIAAAVELLKQQTGVSVFESDTEWPTPSGDSAGKDPVFIGRIRKDISHDRGLNLWVVADNIRKGAALNAVQIAEKLASQWHQNNQTATRVA